MIVNVDIDQRLECVRSLAIKGGIPMRRKDRDLYKLLAAIMSFVEYVREQGKSREIREAIYVHIDVRGQGNRGRGRRYLEASSDVFNVVCRYVLDGEDSRDAIYRYARSLREADRRGICSNELVDWLTSNGGLMALKALEDQSRCQKRSTSKLWLTVPIELPAVGEPFTVTLVEVGNSRFRIVK